MAPAEVEVKMAAADGAVYLCRVSFVTAPNVTLTARSSVFGAVTFTAHDLFDALVAFRVYLEARENWAVAATFMCCA